MMNAAPTPQRVYVVTDSTADVPAPLVEELEITVVPNYINFGLESLRDQVEISRQSFYRRLATEPVLPTTAAPSVGDFEAAYRRLLPRLEGAGPGSGIVSIHCAANLSAIHNTALLASRSLAQVPIAVLNSGMLTMALGWQVIAAARAARAGASLEEVVATVEALRPRVRLYAVLDTLEFLHRSGRVSWARAAMGALLRIKPIVEVRDGQVFQRERVRTRKRAVARLVEITEALGPLEALAVLHTNAPEAVEQLHRTLAARFPDAETIVEEATPVLGVHVGPGALGIAAVVRAPDTA
ncbi:MAG TPA: DegV family protein [Chloroflexi bacterium]|nr:DegV family protein [Chloroflexota bacterium]